LSSAKTKKQQRYERVVFRKKLNDNLVIQDVVLKYETSFQSAILAHIPQYAVWE